MKIGNIELGKLFEKRGGRVMIMYIFQYISLMDISSTFIYSCIRGNVKDK